MTEKKKLGDYGERLTCERLEKAGFKIICKNYRRKCGEIDIIAENKNMVVFVEVKTRVKNSLVRGVYAINKEKQKRLVKTAQLFLSENEISGKETRFDAAEIVAEISEGIFKTVELNYFKEAFDPSGLDIFLFE